MNGSTSTRSTLPSPAAKRATPSGETERAAGAYERLLARRPEAYAHHAAVFFMGIGNRPQLAVGLARANWKLRDTPRSRGLLGRALRNAEQASMRKAPIA